MKTRITFIALLFIFAGITAYSQTVELAYNSEATVPQEPSKLPEMTMMAPSFVGGHEALADYISSNVEYPLLAKKRGVEGTVLVEYYIATDGSIENISVVQSVSIELDKEAIRLIQNMPKWTPAIQNNEPIRVKYTQPVKFELNF